VHRLRGYVDKEMGSNYNDGTGISTNAKHRASATRAKEDGLTIQDALEATRHPQHWLDEVHTTSFHQ
jgi:hypothetical protein